MAAFSRRPDDITARLSDVIEHLQSDAVQEQAEERLYCYSGIEPAAHLQRRSSEGRRRPPGEPRRQAGMNRVNLAP